MYLYNILQEIKIVLFYSAISGLIKCYIYFFFNNSADIYVDNGNIGELIQSIYCSLDVFIHIKRIINYKIIF